ncbi:MAG TPA: MFS transporter [Stellaceae bacterium]|nr:MFS transporter [Stellaceae bacterium]
MPSEPAPIPAALGASRLDSRVLLLALGTFALGTDVFVIAGILRLIAAGLAVSTEAAGQLATAYALTYAVGSPLLAAAAARWRRERVVVLALAGFGLADAICAVAPNYGVLLAARILAGASGALFSPTAYGMAAALTPPDRRGVALATVALGMTTATVFGAPLGTWIAHSFGWHASFLLGALLSAVAAAALAMARGTPTPLTAVPRLVERFSPLARPAVLLSLVANWLWSAGNYTIYHYSAVFFGSRLHLDNIMWLLASYGLGGVAGSQLGGRFVDRFGAVAPIIVCVGINAANLTLLNITGATVWGAGVALFILAFAGWAVFPAQQMRLLQLEPAHGGLVLSLISSTIYIGSATGAALGGLLLARFPPMAPAYVAGAMTAGGLLVFIASLLAAPRQHRSMPR